MYLHEPYGIAATSSHITHARKQHLLISDSLYEFSTFKRKRLVILEPKTASHYHDQSLPVIDQSLPGPKFHDQSFANQPGWPSVVYCTSSVAGAGFAGEHRAGHPLVLVQHDNVIPWFANDWSWNLGPGNDWSMTGNDWSW